MKITKSIVEAYLSCKLKAYFIINGKHQLQHHEYTKMIRKEAEKGRELFVKREKDMGSCLVEYKGTLNPADKTVICNAIIENSRHSSEIDFLIPINKSPDSLNHSYVPAIIILDSKPTVNDKYILAYSCFVLSNVLSIKCTTGYVINIRGAIKKINVEALVNDIKKSWQNYL